MNDTLDSIRVQEFSANMSVNPQEDSASVVLIFPNGTRVRADVQRKDIGTALTALQHVYLSHVAANKHAPVGNETAPQEALSAVGAEVRLQWVEMPDQVLPAHVKYAMALDLDLPELLTLAQVTQIRDRIVEDYTEIQWDSLATRVKANQDAASGGVVDDYLGASTNERGLLHGLEDPSPPLIPMPVATAPVAPTRQGLEWGEGTVMRPSVPSRTVPRDDAGYPIVQRAANTVDPGEVAASADDDGVAQF
jgi:hypothetical protein